MNTITLTIAATPHNLVKLAQAFGESIDDYIGADDIPVKAGGADLKVGGSHAPTKPADIPVSDPAVPPMPQAEEPKEAPEKVVTKTDIREIGLRLTKAGKADALKQVLSQFGAANISQLKESDYPQVLDQLEAIA